jgi:hypothetical protein
MLLNLKLALATRRMKQVDLALSLHISPSVFSEIINERRQADAGLRSRIAKKLNVDEAWAFASDSHLLNAQILESSQSME